MSLDLKTATLSSTFGAWEDWRKAAGLLWHAADDMPAPLGTPILAPDDGEVVYSGFGFGTQPGTLGYYTIFDAGRYGLLLAHQDRAYPALVGPVEEGGVIGYSGNTGWSTGPHVHTVCSVLRYGNGRFDFTRESGGVVSSRLMLTDGYLDGRGYKDMTVQARAKEGVWTEVTKRITTKGEWEALDYQGVQAVWVQSSDGNWSTLGPMSPPWLNTRFPKVLPAPTHVQVVRT